MEVSVYVNASILPLTIDCIRSSWTWPKGLFFYTRYSRWFCKCESVHIVCQLVGTHAKSECVWLATPVSSVVV
jgi:hypothetical protein